jgi:hypothetical protein
MEINNQFKKTDAEESGRWFDYGDARLLIASTRSEAFRKSIAIRGKPYAAQARRGVMPAKVLDSITREAMAEHILLGWDGITENGKAVEYSNAAALDFLERYPKFTELVLEFASNEAAFLDELDEEAIDNLKND